MGPRISYLICATHRSGSNILCQALWHTYYAGRPAEFFSPRHVLRCAQAYRTPPADQDFSAYFRGLSERSQTPNGVFGAKLMWSQTRHIVNYAGLRNRRELYRLLSSFLPGVQFIWNTRRDKVRQAISFLKAKQTQIFTSHQLGRGKVPEAPPHYDHKRLTELVRRLQDEDTQWQRWFEAHRITPFRVDYETFATSMEQITREILLYLGIDLPADYQFKLVTHTKLADETNEEWYARYMAQSGDNRAAGD